MSQMSANFIVRKMAKNDKKSLLGSFLDFNIIGAQKYVSHISDISHLMKFIVLVFIFRQLNTVHTKPFHECNSKIDEHQGISSPYIHTHHNTKKTELLWFGSAANLCNVPWANWCLTSQQGC